MLKKTVVRLSCLAAMVSVLFIAQAQTEEQGWKKTITLPSGEVVCDLTGEWDMDYTPKGDASSLGQQIISLQISQQGGSFKGITTNNSPYASKGYWAIQGEFDRNGFKKFIVFGEGNFPGSVCGGDRKGCSVKLIKNGDIIEFSSSWLDAVLTRR